MAVVALSVVREDISSTVKCLSSPLTGIDVLTPRGSVLLFLLYLLAPTDRKIWEPGSKQLATCLRLPFLVPSRLLRVRACVRARAYVRLGVGNLQPRYPHKR